VSGLNSPLALREGFGPAALRPDHRLPSATRPPGHGDPFLDDKPGTAPDRCISGAVLEPVVILLASAGAVLIVRARSLQDRADPSSRSVAEHRSTLVAVLSW
jgi:hypothetical protein